MYAWKETFLFPIEIIPFEGGGAGTVRGRRRLPQRQLESDRLLSGRRLAGRRRHHARALEQGRQDSGSAEDCAPAADAATAQGDQ